MYVQIHTITFRGIEPIADPAGVDRIGRVPLAKA